MTALPAAPVSTAAIPAPSTTKRSSDSQDDCKQAQAADGAFHEELTREMSSLQNQASNQASAAKGDRDSAARADRGQRKDRSDKGLEHQRDKPLEPADPASASLASMLTGAISVPEGPADAKLLPAATDPAVQNGGDSASASGSALALILASASTSVSTSASLAASVSATSVSAKAAVGGAGTARGIPAKLPVTASAGPDHSDPNSALADSNAGGVGSAAEKSAVESRLAAGAAMAESAVTGKSLPQGRDALLQGVSTDAGIAQHHAADAQPLAAMGATAALPPQVAHTSTATAAISAHLAAPGWDRGLGEKMVWMAGRQLQVAELSLNPPELGPLQVTLTINNDQANAQFVSQHAAVREAIESAMPRLREMLAAGGITLGNASVSADSFREQAQQDSRNPMPRAAGQAGTDGTFRVTQILRATHGLVDIFA